MVNFLKLFSLILFTLISYYFCLHGINFVNEWIMILYISFIAAILTNFMTMKRKKLRIENDFIAYKKTKIPFSEVKKLVLVKTFTTRGIAIYGHKKNISLYNVSPDDYDEIHEILLSKLGNVTIKYPKRPSPFFMNYLVYAFFVFTLIFAPSIPREEFSSNSEIKPNSQTENYAFYLDNIEFSQEVNENIMNVITPSGKIFFREHHEEEFARKERNEILPFSPTIDYLDSKPIGIVHWILRKGLIRRDNPKIYYSKEYKAYYSNRKSNEKLLQIKRIDENIFLRFRFYGDFSGEYILNLLESIEFRY